MAVLGRLLFASAERLDLPDLLSIDSFTAGDFKFLLKGLIGDDRPLILRGFDVINPEDAIGSQSLSIRVADSVVLYPGSLAGPFFHGLEEGNANAQPLVPELRKNATNFVYLTFSTFETARDTRAFWDPDLDGGEGGEFTQDINTESVLRVNVNVSVSAFPDNTIPICKVVVGPSVIESIEDAREQMFRLGEGGVNPDPFSRYNFRNDPTSAFARKEPPTTMSSALDPNPFQGGDKNILSLKEWMDVVMTKLAELGGTTFWYEDTGAFGLVNLFLDALGRSFKSKGVWEHSSATPGLLTWTEDIHLKYASDDRDIIIRNANKTLQDEEVMYIELVRGANINTGNVSVEWFNGLDFVNGVVGAFENLEKGDWVKKIGDPNRNYRRVEEFFADDNLGGGVTSPALAKSIRLSDVYEGISEVQQGEYTKGSYDSSEVFVVARSEADALNGGKFLDDIGGNLTWLALRSDTIMSVDDITTTSLTGIDITEADGSTAKVTSTGHGLVDGDRVTITDSVAGYNGTYVVDVVDADNFYINTPDNGDELGVANAYYAIVTTTTREIDGGFEVESAQHNFEDNQTITIAGTSSGFDAAHEIKVRTPTTFSIPVGSAIPSVSTGTATLARINVRSEFGMVELKQGEGTGIGEGDTSNVMSYIGMASIAETHPTYNLPAGYNTLDGTSNYNGETDDNLTVRAAKLTAMMADKAQDKTIKLLLENIDRVTNTQNVLAQDITFTSLAGLAKTMHVVLPNSANNGSVTLAGTLSLNANQAAYFTIDRNASFTVASLAALTVTDIEDVPLDENVFVFAVRLANEEVWLWDGTLVENDETRALSSHKDEIDRQDRNLKLVRGGTWSWDLGTNTLANSADAFIQIPGLPEGRNTIDAQSIVLPADGDVAYVELNRNTGAVDSLTVNVAAIASVDPTLDTYIIARRIGDDVLVGEEGGQLTDGESQELDASASDQTLAYIGAADESDSDPDYSSENVVSDGDDLTTAIGKLDSAAGAAASANNQDRTLKLIGGGTWSWDLGAGELSFSADAFIQVPDLANVRNRIPTSESPIALADGDVAYVEINRAAGPAADLTVSVDPVASVGLTDNTVVIARRIGSNVIVGSSSFKLIDGQSEELERNLSIQTRALLGSGVTEATSDPDYATRGAANRTIGNSQGFADAIASVDAEINKFFGQLQLTEDDTPGDRVKVSGVDRTMLDGTVLSQELRNLLLSFDGAEIDFATGEIFESDGVTPLGIDFTPATIATNEWQWYSVTLVASTVNADNSIGAQLVVVPAVGSGATKDAAPKPAFANGKKLGLVAVQEDGGGGINAIVQADIRQLGVGSGSGGGAGDGNELLERLKDQLTDGVYENLTPNIFLVDEDDLVDTVASTSTFDVANTLFKFNNPGDTHVSFDLLDDDFLAEGKDVGSIEWSVFWNDEEPTQIDPAATYEVSRDGGAHWQEVTMDRVGNTETFRGVHIFKTETDSVVLDEYLLANADADVDLDDGSAAEAVSQEFVTAEDRTLESVSLTLRRTGSPAGNYRMKLVRDSGGLPSTAANATVFAGDFTAVSSIPTSDTKTTLILADGIKLEAGTYHIVIETDAAYQASYSDGVDEITARADSSAPTVPLASRFNGSVWSQHPDSALIYEVVHAQESNDLIDEYGVVNADAVRELNTTTQQRVSQPFTLTDTEVIRQVTLYTNKLGIPDGGLFVALAEDDSGSPGAILAESNIVDIDDIASGNGSIDVRIPTTALAAGTYHLVIRTDAAYKNSYDDGVTELRLRTDSSSPTASDLSLFDGSSWSAVSGEALTYNIAGRNLELRVRITSSQEAELKGYGVFYELSSSGIVGGVDKRQIESFEGDVDNENEFIIDKFLPDPDLLKVYELETGQVYVFGAFALDGHKVIFPVDTFNKPGTVTLLFDQNNGGSFDNSDKNAALLAANFLGSTDAEIDRSQNGRGILLRRPDGTLREIAVDDDDNIVVYSV